MDMMSGVGWLLLFFLPVIESYDRSFGLVSLFLGSICVGYPMLFQKRLSFDRLENVWFVLLSVLACSTVASIAMARSVTEFARYVSYALIFFRVRRLPESNQFLKRWYMPMVITNGTILSILSLLYAIPETKLLAPYQGMNFYYPVFGHNHIVDLLLFTIPLAIVWMYADQKTWHRVLRMLCATLFIGVFVLSLGRAAWFSFGVAFLGMRGRLMELRFLLFFIILCFIAISTVYVYPLGAEPRFSFVKQAGVGFVRSPVFGTGLDTFRYISMRYQEAPFTWSWYVHNHFIQMFTETGVFGGVIYFVLIGMIFVQILDTRVKVLQADVLILALIATTVQSFLDFNFQFLSVFLLFWIGAALLLPHLERNNPATATRFRLFFAIAILVQMASVFFLFFHGTAIERAEVYQRNGKRADAKRIFTQVLRFDRENTDIAHRLARLSYEGGEWDNYHRWNQYVLIRNPLDFSFLVQEEYISYLTQANISLQHNDVAGANRYLTTANRLYPLYHKDAREESLIKSVRSSFASEDMDGVREYLTQYMQNLQDATDRRKPTTAEMQHIAENIRLYTEQ